MLSTLSPPAPQGAGRHRPHATGVETGGPGACHRNHAWASESLEEAAVSPTLGAAFSLFKNLSNQDTALGTREAWQSEMTKAHKHGISERI